MHSFSLRDTEQNVPCRAAILIFSAIEKKVITLTSTIFLKPFHVCSDCEPLCLRVKNYTDMSGIADYRPFFGKYISLNFLSDRLSDKDG